MLTRLRLDFSHLHKHKFRHSFKYKLNPFCSCIIEVKATIHYFLRCRFYNSRSSHQRCSIEKGGPKNFTKFTAKDLCQSLFSSCRCFPVNLVKFLKTSYRTSLDDCFYNSNQANLMYDLENIRIFFFTVSDNSLISLDLYGIDKFDDIKYRKTLMSTIRFIKYSQRFDNQFF